MNTSPKPFLSPGHRKLIELMRETPYGKIVDIHVCQGEPVFEPLPTVIESVELGATFTPHANNGSTLSDKHRALFQRLDKVKTTAFVTIFMKDGIPIRCEITSPAQIG